MTYWVEYGYTCTIDGDEFEDIGSGRFHCRKKDIQDAVELRVREELEYEKYSDLSIQIYDFYRTTDVEV